MYIRAVVDVAGGRTTAYIYCLPVAVWWRAECRRLSRNEHAISLQTIRLHSSHCTSH